MKTVFIVNPKAGQGKNIRSLLDSIKKSIFQTKADAEIYITKCVGDATRFVSRFCAEKGPARFIACGGDGTLNEVLNGSINCTDAQIGVVPLGTGNDFCRNFDSQFDFSNISYQITGRAEKCDAMHYTTVFNGVKKEGYCINMLNIGFDCNVADMSANMKKKPFVSGSMAYFLSILIAMIKKKGADLSVEIDSEIVHKGRLLLTSIANGCYCGGGIKSNPLALVSDGVMNVNIIKNIKRLQFIPLLPHYMNGTILDVKNIDRFLINKDCHKIVIKPRCKNMRMCVDGEIIDAGETTIEVIHNAFSFVNKNQVLTQKEEMLLK
ncbi:MAG: YegS/Rv2252/BmrU family lipid kinase [Ruminococcaceae bacterium]|nr:YegS/Rv2252/BmrU family lipid kinase [Oscillospiraceae bacterium]